MNFITYATETKVFFSNLFPDPTFHDIIITVSHFLDFSHVVHLFLLCAIIKKLLQLCPSFHAQPISPCILKFTLLWITGTPVATLDPKGMHLK